MKFRQLQRVVGPIELEKDGETVRRVPKARAQGQKRGGAERANYQMFLTELCEALDLPRPDPASDDTRTNDYVFERGAKRRESEGLASTLRIERKPIGM